MAFSAQSTSKHSLLTSSLSIASLSEQAASNNAAITTFRHTTHHNVDSLDRLKSQLHHLSPTQLRELRGAINSQLDDQPRVRITDEEQRLINSLF